MDLVCRVFLQGRAMLCVALVMFLASAVCLTNPVRSSYVVSDPYGQLIVSENIIQHHRLDLDNLAPFIQSKIGWAVNHLDNDPAKPLYYYFPFGTPLLSIPFVAIANVLGIGMMDHEGQMEGIICALVAATTILVLYRISRLFLPAAEGLTLAGVTWFGSAWSSTGATALWSQDYSTLLASIAIWLTLREPRVLRNQSQIAIGLCLFFAYLCRPTFAILSPILLTMIALQSFRSAVITGLIVAGCLALFFAFNIFNFHELLPLYYASSRIGTGNILLGTLCNLISPARGLFVYSPFFVLPFLVIPWVWRSSNRQVLLIGVVWPVFHILSVANTDHWWGGFCFGARFSMDILPGLFTLLCVAWSVVRKRPDVLWFAPAFAVAASLAIWINTTQGLNNLAPVEWNAIAQVDSNQSILFNWTHPQFLATQISNYELRTYVAAHQP